jgi:hypothetical protein
MKSYIQFAPSTGNITAAIAAMEADMPTWEMIWDRDAQIAALKAERDKLAKEAATSTAAFIKQCGDLDKLRAALEDAADTLEANGFPSAGARRALGDK